MENRKNDNVCQDNFDEMSYSNSQLVKCYGILSGVLLLAYLAEWLKGSRTLGYTAVFAMLVLIPLILTVVVKRIRPGFSGIKRIVAVGFGILYAFVLLTSNSQISFVYVLPMLVAIMVYGNKRYTLWVGVIATMVNVIYVVVSVKNSHVQASDIVNYEIEIALMILVVIFSYITANATEQINRYKMNLIDQEKRKTDGMLQDIMMGTEQLSGKISGLNIEADGITQQGQDSKKAMEEITEDINELTVTIQNQLQMNGEIKQLVEQMESLTVGIRQKFQITRKITDSGKKNMESLEQASRQSGKASEEVNQTLDMLVEKTREVGEILSLIEGITNQTTLLALNASIEAAHAGEAGKGFAVVAEEIKQLAEQTKNATEQINQMFLELETDADQAGKSIVQLAQAEAKQVAVIAESKETFDRIDVDVNEVNGKIKEQNAHMEQIASINVQLYESIENISAFSEELVSNTENTRTITHETLDGTFKISSLLDEAMVEVKKLQESRKNAKDGIGNY